MSRFNKLIKDNIKLIMLIIITFQSIIDSITITNTSLQISFGIIIKILSIFLIIYYIVFLSKNVYRKKSIYLIVLMLFYTISFIISNHNITSIINNFYFPIIFIGIFNIYHNDNKKLDNKYLSITVSIPIIMVLLINIINGNLLNSGLNSVIAITIPILFVSMYDKFNFFKLFLLLFTMYIVFIIGNSVCFLSLFLSLLIYCIMYISIFIKNKSKKNTYFGLISLIVIAVTLFVLLLSIPTYKNIKFFNYSRFTEKINILKDTNNIYIKSSIKEKLFGISNSGINKTTGIDLFDILYSYGIIGFMIFFGSIGYLIIFSKKTYNKNYIFPLLLTVFVSIFNGCVFDNTYATFLLSIILIRLLYDKNNLNKKELLFCAYSLGLGGIEQALINLLNNINYSKYNVTVMLEKKEGIFLNQINQNVQVIEYKVSDNKNIFIRKGTNFLRQIKWFLTYYKNFDFSCCYATYSLSCNLISRMSSNNSMLYVHSNYTQVYNTTNEVKYFFDNRSIEKFRKIVFVSNESMIALTNIYPNIKDKCMVINNFIDQNKIINKSKEKINEIKPKDKLLFLFVGRIDDSAKNIFKLINIFKSLISKNKNIELWLIGDGPDSAEAREMIKKYKLDNNIKMLGAKKNPYPYMKKADYIILVSRHEGFPVVYNEAIVLNIPIITTINVTDDFISIPDRFGYIVPDDEKKIIDDIFKIINDKNFKMEKIDFNNLNKKKIENLEMVFDEVV